MLVSQQNKMVRKNEGQKLSCIGIEHLVQVKMHAVVLI